MWAVYSLTSHDRPSQFERIVEALIYSVAVSAIVGLEKKFLLYAGKWIRLGVWDNDTELIFSVLSAIALGLAISCLINKDTLFKIFRKLNISQRSSHPSNWHYVLSTEPTYIILHLNDERRLYGWPLMWPSKSDKDHFHMTNCAWLGDVETANNTENAQLELPQKILICAIDVRWVELMPKEI